MLGVPICGSFIILGGCFDHLIASYYIPEESEKHAEVDRITENFMQAKPMELSGVKAKKKKKRKQMFMHYFILLSLSYEDVVPL